MVVKADIKGNEGFTLVELLVVIAIVAVMSTSAAVGINRVSYANFQKTASQVYNELNDCRSICMSHANPAYTYICNKGDELYIFSSLDKNIPYVTASTVGKKISNSAVELYYVDSSGDPDNASSYTKLTDGNMIVVSFKMNGSFKTGEPSSPLAFYKAIRVQKKNSALKKDILMIQETGKRFMQ